MPDPILTAALDENGVPIPAEELRQRVEAGHWHMAAGGQLAMVGPGGESQLFDEAGARQAIQQGWFPEPVETQQERALESRYGGFGQGLVAAGEAALESVPLVGSALLHATESEQDRLAREERAKRNPIARGVGTVAGIGAQVLATGLVGGAARGLVAAPKVLEAGEAALAGTRALEAGEVLAGAAEAVPAAARALPVALPEAAGAVRTLGFGLPTKEAAAEALTLPWRALVIAPGKAVGGVVERGLAGAGASERLASVGGRVAQMGTEGAAVGVASELAEDELHATPLRAEHLAHAAGMGLLFGAGAEAGLAGLGAAGRKLLGKAATAEGLEDIAVNQRFHALGAKPSEARKLGPGVAERLGERLGGKLEDGTPIMKALASTEDMQEPIHQALQTAVKKLSAEKDVVASAIAEQPELAPKLERFWQKLQNDVYKPLEESLVGESRRQLEQIKFQLAPLRSRYLQATEGELVPHVADAVERQAARQTEKALGQFAEVWRKNSAELGETLAERGYQDFSGELAKLLKQSKVEIPAGVNLGELEQMIQKAPQKFGRLMADDFDGFLATAGDSLGGVPAAQKFDRVFGPPLTIEELWTTRTKLGDIIYKNRKAYAQGLPPPVSIDKYDLMHSERILSDEIAETGERALAARGMDPTSWRAINQEYSDWKRLQELIDKSAEQRKHRAAGGLYETITGTAGLHAAFTGVMHGHPAALLGLATGPIHHALRERGPALLAKAAQGMANVLRGIESRNTVAARVIGLGKSAVEAAPLAAIFVASRMPTTPQRPKEDIGEVISSLRDFNNLAPSEQVSQARSTLGDFAETHPRQADMAAQAMVGQTRYLASKLPKPAKLIGVRPKEMLDPVSEARFRDILHAVADPVGLFEDVSRGTVPSRDSIDAVKATSPAMFARMREQVQEALRERTTEVTPADARMFYAVFGLSVAPETDPEIGAHAQVVIADLQAQADKRKQEERTMARANAPSLATRSQELEKGSAA